MKNQLYQYYYQNCYCHYLKTLKNIPIMPVFHIFSFSVRLAVCICICVYMCIVYSHLQIVMSLSVIHPVVLTLIAICSVYGRPCQLGVRKSISLLHIYCFLGRFGELIHSIFNSDDDLCITFLQE